MSPVRFQCKMFLPKSVNAAAFTAADWVETDEATIRAGAATLPWEIAKATTDDLAQMYGRESNQVSLPKTSGLYHLTAASETGWYEFATTILQGATATRPTTAWFRAATKNRTLITRGVVPIGTKEYPAPACRPAYSVFFNARLMRIFEKHLPDWLCSCTPFL